MANALRRSLRLPPHLLHALARRRLAPEGEVRELDVPASRCTPVKAFLVARTSDADREVWDILDSEPYATPNMQFHETVGP